MSRQDCVHWNSCCAPLCPLDEQTMRDGRWFTDEEVCRASKPPRWIRLQRRIAKVAGQAVERGFFTAAMLDRVHAVKAGVEGVQPGDIDAEIQRIKAWLKLRPGPPQARQLSEEDKAVLRERMRRAREVRVQHRKNEVKPDVACVRDAGDGK